MTQTANSIANQIQAVNAVLKAGEPANISIDSYSGFTGYKPQAIIDAMNEVIGFGNWGFEEISNEIAEGEKATLTISQVRAFLKDVAFQPTGWGQARITKGDIGDAKKGAQTDALKKALSYFSIGNRAYHGLLEASNGTSGKNGNTAQQKRPPANAPKPITAPTSTQLRKRCKELYPYTPWEEVIKRLFKRDIPDSEMGPDQCQAIHEAFEKVAARRAQNGTSGK